MTGTRTLDSGPATGHPSTPWLEAILYRWSARPRSHPDADDLVVAARQVGVDLRFVGAPTAAGPGRRAAASDPTTSTSAVVTSGAVAAVLAELWRRGIGGGLIGAVGRLPGLPPRVHRFPGGPTSLRAVLDAQGELRAHRHVPAVDDDPAWTVQLDGRDPARMRVEESVYTVADGVFGTRGTLEEDGPGSVPMVVAAGCYAEGAPGELEGTPQLLPGPAWTQLDLRDPPPRRRTLDLRTGVLLRESDPDRDAEVPLRVVRFASLARPGTCVLRAEGAVDRLAAGPDLLVPDAEGTHVRRAQSGWSAATSSRRAWIGATSTTEVVDDDAGRRRIDRRVQLRRGSGARVTTDPNDDPPRHERPSFAEVLDDHRAAWAARWETADVEIGGDPDLQLAVRFALFHLMGSVASVGEAAVGARGLTGPAYRGHVFWDADVFVLPFLAATHPPAARAMLAYRVARLPAARERAVVDGYAGARFPWESADDGTDVTPGSFIGLDGRRRAILAGSLQEHITADVAWAASHYLRWVDDRAFERGDARDLLFETARYWRSRITLDRSGRGHIRGVMGPDEYHAPVDDDVFTNGMASWNLGRAATFVGATDPPHLRREANRWRHLADDLVDGYDPATGRHEQFAGFAALTPMRIGDLARVPVAADVLLGPERAAGAQVVKQADVLMLHHLLPRLRPRGSLVRDLDHYLPLTAHGSSLSPGIHASLLARVGRPDEALPLLRLAARIDLDDVTGTTAGGLHLATAGSVWQALVYGFLGVWTDHHATLHVDPHLPRSWTSLTVNLLFRGQHVRLCATDGRLEVRCDRPLRLMVGRRFQRTTPPVSVHRFGTDGARAEGRS
jgi:trehalose/maltose hydrolase-like predicted phosphorylase